MILTRSTRLSQPQGPVEISPDFGGLGVVYLPNVQSNINRVAGTVGRGPTPQGVSAVYTAGAETKIERLNGSAPNGITEFTQIVYLTPIAGGAVNDRGIFGNWNTTGATSLVQLVHRARDATTNGRYCYVVSYDPTSGATSAGLRTSDYSAVDNVPAVLIATVKNNTLSLYLNGVLHNSTAVAAVAMSGQAELQIGNYYDNTSARRLSAKVHLASFLPRGLGGSEVAALSRNPWQLFRPVQRRVYFDMGAGGGGVATHDTSGAITSSTAELSGAAERTRQHNASAGLAGAGSVVSGTAQRNVTLVSSGALAGGLAVVTASASHTAGPAEHATSGGVAASGALLSGSASRVPAPVTHDTSGDLGGIGATIDGQAQGPQSASMRPGFEMSSRKVYIKRGKRIHIFDTVEDADAWVEAEQQATQAIEKAKGKKKLKAKAKAYKALDEQLPHEVIRLDVVRSMVDYLGIPVEMPTLEARQDWAEVARVALMARHMQDEEDIELLLAA